MSASKKKKNPRQKVTNNTNEDDTLESSREEEPSFGSMMCVLESLVASVDALKEEGKLMKSRLDNIQTAVDVNAVSVPKEPLHSGTPLKTPLKTPNSSKMGTRFPLSAKSFRSFSSTPKVKPLAKAQHIGTEAARSASKFFEDNEGLSDHEDKIVLNPKGRQVIQQAKTFSDVLPDGYNLRDLIAMHEKMLTYKTVNSIEVLWREVLSPKTTQSVVVLFNTSNNRKFSELLQLPHGHRACAVQVRREERM